MKSPLQAFPTRRFWVAIFALVSLGIMAGGLAYYRYEQDHIRREKYQELAAIADLKVRQILEWRRERLDDGRSLARAPFLRQAIAAWLRDPGNQGLRAALLEQFKIVQESYAYGNVLLAAPDGRILLSVRPDPAPLSPGGKQALEAAIAGRQALLGDLFRCPKDHRVHLDVAAPVLDNHGRPLAVAVLRATADEVLYPLIQSWPTPSRSAETLLMEVEGKDVLFLNDLRHREKTALSLREPLTQTGLPAVQAALGKRGMYHGRDYRDVEVLADLRPVPQSPWFMVTKVDADETMAEARYRAGITALFVVIFILLTAAVTAYGYRQRQANLYQDLYQTERERRQAQEEFRTTLYSIGDAVITTDTEGLVKQINPVAERLTGWLEAEARGKPLEEVFRIINEETRTAVENPVQRVLREGVVVGLANHNLLVARDGAERFIADSGAPIRDENGAVIGVVLVFRDQTEERAAQKTMQASEELYRSLFQNMLNGFAYCKMLFEQNQAQDFIYLNVNNSFEELTGLKNVGGKRVSEVIPGIRESDPELFEIYGRVALTGKPERFETHVEALKMWFSISVYSPEREYFVAVFDVITQRKRVEEALKKNEATLQSIFMASPVGIGLVNNRLFFWTNKQLSEITGYTGDELKGQSARMVYESDAEFERVGRVKYAEIIERGKGTIETRWRRKDGSLVNILLSSAPIDPARPTEEVIFTAMDITERKLAEKALRASEEKYRLLVNQIPAVVFKGFGDWSIDFFDHKIEALTGFPKEEFDSRKIKWCDLILPEDLNNSSRIFIEALKTNQSYVREYRIRKKDGSISWIQAMGRIFCDDAGKIDHISGVFFDITARQRAEEALRDHLNLLQTLIDTIPSPIFYKNLEGIYEGCNQALSDFLGLPKEKIIGKSVYDIYPKDQADKYFKMDSALFRQPGVQIYDFSMQHADGTRHEVNFNKATYTTIDGALAGLVGVMIDITERKKAEVERLRFSKLESLAILAGGIAHDFNNILTAIIGNISLAMLDLGKTEYIRERLTEAEKACLQAQNLSRQLLTLAKGGAPIKEPVSVEKLLTESGAFVCSGSKTRCEYNFPENLWAAEADPGQAGQVFQNLIINAIQAMPAGGTIQVRGENLAVEAESDLPLGSGRYVKIAIEDQGVGIPADFLPKIFDPYFTTKQTGSGLGLATVYSIVKSHHGHISVESKLGVGTTFHIYLPAADQKIIEPPDEARKLSVGHGKVLVMDDEEMVRETLGKMLGHLGYEVKLAGDGGEAIELFASAQESGKPFDAVILDLTVPGGLGGKETLAGLVEIDPRVKAIVSSGYSDDPIMADFKKYGFSGVIAKPYRISELANILSEVVRGKP